METVIKGKTRPKDVLDAFLQNKYLETDDGKIATINSTEDLALIGKFYNSAQYDSPVRKAAEERIGLIADGIFAGYSEFAAIMEWFHKNSWSLRNSSSLFGRFLKRLKVMCDSCESMETLIHYWDICDKHYVSEEAYGVYHVVEGRMIEAAKADPNRYSFEFLRKIWRSTGSGFPARNKIGELMPVALAFESDIKKLVKWMSAVGTEEGVWSSWNHHDHNAYAAVRHRTCERVQELTNETDDVQMLDWYLRVVSGRKAVEQLVITRIGELVIPPIKDIPSISKLKEYYGTLPWDARKYGLIIRAFQERFEQLLSKRLKCINDAEKVYPYLDFQFGDSLRPNETSQKMIRERFIKLLPKFCRKKPDVAKVFKWHQYQYGMRRTLRPFIIEMVPSEKNIEAIANAMGKYGNEELESHFKVRLAELLTDLTEPSDWFLACLKEKKFFGNEELFTQKAKEFATAA
ncbi:MAG: hypothetical protein JWM20_814 [Patescibacteria group bacterium]|nr:hypothetical protein [Patescibacteria group bacterium]